ncbi:MAG: NAD(P)H-hydrate dehydratase [Xanthobacteraceae bacterium]
MTELLTNAEMGRCDRLTIEGGTPGIVLMQKAGLAVADCVARRPLGIRVVLVAGPGNNGGDAFVAARILRERGYRLQVMLVGDAARLKGDAAEAAQQWGGPTEPADPAALAGADLIVDGLFGAGLDREVEGLPRAMIEAMNASHAPVVAIDLPSGINGTTGAVMGVAVNAVESVTFFRAKPGHYLLPGRLHCGTVRIADIGIKAETLAEVRPQTFLNTLALWERCFPMPRMTGHKYSRGHAVIVSGPATTTGAARMAARGALRAGAGLVTIASPRDALAVNAATNLAVMVRPVDGGVELTRFLEDKRFNAVGLGPGLGVGAATCDLVLAALADARAVVLDADALTSFSDDAPRLFAAIKARGPASTILTPHEGEFARLFGALADAEKPAASKLERARRAAQQSGAVLLLKGADTVIADPQGRAAINANAPAWLATAGAGDVLTGFTVGLSAQGMPGFEAACAAVWLHAEVAVALGPGLIAEDLPEGLPKIYRGLYEKFAADAPYSTN